MPFIHDGTAERPFRCSSVDRNPRRSSLGFETVRKLERATLCRIYETASSSTGRRFDSGPGDASRQLRSAIGATPGGACPAPYAFNAGSCVSAPPRGCWRLVPIVSHAEVATASSSRHALLKGCKPAVRGATAVAAIYHAPRVVLGTDGRGHCGNNANTSQHER